MSYLKRKMRKILRRNSLAKAHAKHRKLHESEYSDIDRTLAEYRAAGGVTDDEQEYKLWTLRNMLKRFGAESILELGSGASTHVISKFVRETSSALLSIDEDEKWGSVTRSQVDIQPGENIEIRICQKLTFPDTLPRQIKYDVSLDGEYDFVFIDGPSLEVDGVKWKDGVNTNVYDLPNAPAVIVVDVRLATAEHLAEQYKDKYSIHMSDLFSGDPVSETYNYFSYFVKN